MRGAEELWPAVTFVSQSLRGVPVLSAPADPCGPGFALITPDDSFGPLWPAQVDELAL
jgi:hypothetical protein